MPQQDVPVNPKLLEWARLTAGLDIGEAAQKANITSSRPSVGDLYTSPGDRLLAWEQGLAKPSLNQLKQLAKVYHRPLVTFFLPKPPEQVKAIVDFRTLPGKHVKETPEFMAFKRSILLLQQELKAIREDEQGTPLPFVNSFTDNDRISDIVQSIRTTLEIGIDDQRQSSKINYFTFWRNRIESIGIYVTLLGDLGSYHSKIDINEFRGIAIADSIAPLIVINKNDAKSAMFFTLAHELAHIWLGYSGISNIDTWIPYNGTNNIEMMCNAVAGELLVPKVLLLQKWHEEKQDNFYQCLQKFARHFQVSKEVIARRLFDSNLIPQNDYHNIIDDYKAIVNKNKDKMRQKNGEPSIDNVIKYRFGTKVLSAFYRVAKNDFITLQDAARTLNIPVSRLVKVAS